MGAPVVSTKIAAEGIGSTNNLNILIADTPEDFTASVSRLYSNPEVYVDIAEQAREFTITQYSISETISRRVKLLSDIINEHKIHQVKN
jgi:hypothetical protein